MRNPSSFQLTSAYLQSIGGDNELKYTELSIIGVLDPTAVRGMWSIHYFNEASAPCEHLSLYITHFIFEPLQGFT